VPTEGVKAALRKVIRMHGIQHLVTQHEVDEYLTTKCCWRCGAETEAAPTNRPDGRRSLRYRLCVNCGTGTAGKRRNRDVNAARNILLLLQAELQGLPRPEHLRRPERAPPAQEQAVSQGRRRRT
jgi:transposase